MNCRICLYPVKFAGQTADYFNKADVNIYYCARCDIKFASTNSFTSEIYDKVYSSGELGYHHDETKDKLSLEELARKDINFVAVADSLSPDPLDILEVGCGYGYLTNALNQLGHRARGVDVSRKAIAYAKEIYGDYFEQKEVTEVVGSYDMIIGVELIEHLMDPKGFVKKCTELLKPNGKLIITTPNKDFYNKKTLWMTSPPPIHLFWFGKKAMETMAKNAGLEMRVLPYHKYLMKYDNQNLLVNWLRYRNQKQGVFTSTAIATERGHIRSVLRSIVLSKSIKEISNLIFSFRPVTRTLAVMMTKT